MAKKDYEVEGNNIDGTVTDYSKGVAEKVLRRQAEHYGIPIDDVNIFYLKKFQLLRLLEDVASEVERDMH